MQVVGLPKSFTNLNSFRNLLQNRSSTTHRRDNSLHSSVGQVVGLPKSFLNPNSFRTHFHNRTVDTNLLNFVADFVILLQILRAKILRNTIHHRDPSQYRSKSFAILRTKILRNTDHAIPIDILRNFEILRNTIHHRDPSQYPSNVFAILRTKILRNTDHAIPIEILSNADRDPSQC